jgi:hypothetical protein
MPVYLNVINLVDSALTFSCDEFIAWTERIWTQLQLLCKSGVVQLLSEVEMSDCCQVQWNRVCSMGCSWCIYIDSGSMHTIVGTSLLFSRNGCTGLSEEAS